MRQSKTVTVDARQSWPGDPEQYLSDCLICGGTFAGHKRRTICRLCSAPLKTRAAGAVDARINEHLGVQNGNA